MSRATTVTIRDATTGDTQGVDTLGHADVVAHAHAEGGHILFKKSFTASEDVILIDISDTTNYPHSNTLWLHTANLVLNVDASNTADYVLEIGFLENVDGTNGDFHEVLSISGTRAAGNSINLDISQNPEAPKLKSGGFLGPITLNDTAFQTDVNLRSTLDPTGATATPSGDGDMVMRVTRTAGDFTVSLLVGYHSHQ